MAEQYQTKTSGKGTDQYQTGAQRDSAADKGRYDLIPPEATKRVAGLYERGAIKYEPRNWEKGIPADRCLDSALRHAQQALDNYNRRLRGEAVTDPEDHLAAVAFNVNCLMAYEERGMIDRFIGKQPAKVNKPQESIVAENIYEALYNNQQYGVVGQCRYIPDQGLPENKQETQIQNDHLWRRTIVYVSGPMTNGGKHGCDYLAVGAGMAAGIQLMKAGYAVIVPQLTAYAQTAMAWNGQSLGLNCGLSHEVWLDMDNALVSVSDAVLRMPGESKGADQEVNMARNLGKPVYYHPDTLKANIGQWTKQTLSSKSPVKNATRTQGQSEVW